jgi:ABC-type transporter Mla MlaB component
MRRFEDEAMFRAEIRWLSNGPTLKMEGRLVGDWVEPARSLVTKEVVPQGLIIDLSDLTYVDSTGEQFLKWLASVGAKFVDGNVYTAGICERLRLPLLENTSPGVAAHRRERSDPEQAQTGNCSPYRGFMRPRGRV